MTNRDLLVKKIEKGVVVDHISAGQALFVLNILRPDPTDRIVLAQNVDSSSLGTKDIIKVEGKYLTSKEIDLISLVAPEATINIIENWKVKEKIKIKPPKTIERFFKCPNRSCVTNSEYTSEYSNFQILKADKVENLKLQCVFCDAFLYSENIINSLASTDFIGGLISKEKIERLFLELLLKKGALKIASNPEEFFILKSGRRSPYFINLGSLTDGESLARMKWLLASYVKLLLDQKLLEDFDFVFGPAYKGINLASLVCEGLNESYGINKRYIYDRKEEKQYGDVSADRMIVGGDQFVEGQRILIIDDVTTTGSTKIEVLNKLKSLGSHEVTGLVLVVDRQEKRGETTNQKGESATDFIRKTIGIEVFSILNSNNIFNLVKNNLSEEVIDYWIKYFNDFGTVKLQK